MQKLFESNATQKLKCHLFSRDHLISTLVLMQHINLNAICFHVIIEKHLSISIIYCAALKKY